MTKRATKKSMATKLKELKISSDSISEPLPKKKRASSPKTKSQEAEPVESSTSKLKKAKDQITLEEFFVEKEKDGVKLNQLSRKLMSMVTSDDRKRLNAQDLEDLKEIQGLMEIADI